MLGVLGSTFSQLLARKDAEVALERTVADSQTRFAALLDNIPDPVMRDRARRRAALRQPGRPSGSSSTQRDGRLAAGRRRIRGHPRLVPGGLRDQRDPDPHL